MKLKQFVVPFFTLMLSFLLTPVFAKIYEFIIGRKISGWMAPNPSYAEGFLLSYCVFMSVSITLFAKTKKLRAFLIFLLPLLMLESVLQEWEILIISLGVASVAFLLGWVYGNVFKSKLKTP